VLEQVEFIEVEGDGFRWAFWVFVAEEISFRDDGKLVLKVIEAVLNV
jgi:hypothetical protein